MTYTLKRYQTFREYLNAEELSEERNYRLLSTGEVIELSTESELNRIITIAFILAIQKAKGLSFIRYICTGNKDLQVHPVGDKWVNRKPDVGEEKIASTAFPNIALTVSQLITGQIDD